MNNVRRRPLWRILLWLAALALLSWVVSRVPLAASWGVLRQLRLWQLALLLLVNGLVLLALNGRWWLLLRGQGHTVPYLALTAHRLAAFSLSYFTPGPQFGGEPLQVVLVEREHGVPRTAAVAAVTLDKTVELLVNFAFLAGGVALILQGQYLPASVGGQAAVFALFLLALPLAFLAVTWAGWQPITRLLMWWGRLPFWRGRPRQAAAFRKIVQVAQAGERQATRFCRESPRTLLLALAASGVSWLALIFEYWLMLRFLGLRLTAVQTIVALTAARIAFLLPLPGGLGTLEASLVFALGAMGQSPAAAVSAGVLIRARDLFFGGLGLWWASRRLRLRRNLIKVFQSGLFSLAHPNSPIHPVQTDPEEEM